MLRSVKARAISARCGSRAGAIALSLSVLVGLLVGSGTTAGAAPSKVKAVGSVEQVYVTELKPGSKASLISPKGEVLKTQTVNSLGGVLFRNVKPGKGYRVESGGAKSGSIVVHDDRAKPWDESIYDQEIASTGYQYLTTRDGTKLALTVHPPTSPATLGIPKAPGEVPEAGGAPFLPPYPTLVEYSGYAYARPEGPKSGIAVLANAMGFAVVDIQMRGTGCSGGAFDFFEPLQNLDGYDIIETIARQPWVKGNKVGMMGISYGGISQMFTAQLRPPSLAAISPLSVIDATATTLYPGGNLNTGFAAAWAEERQKEAQAAGPDKGQPYAWERIQNGDEVCEANQALHPEAADLRKKIDANEHYVPEVADPLDPVTFVDKINVPTFLVCQWQDEQTGGHCPELASKFTGTDKKWFTFTNGTHADSLAPETFNRWYDFLQLYVAEEAPAIKQAPIRAAAPAMYQLAFGLPQDSFVTLPPDPIQTMPTYEMALEAFEALPQVRVLFDNGAGRSPTGQQEPGNPYPGFEYSFDSWPIKETKAQTWYFGPKGKLSAKRSSPSGVDTYTSDPDALPLTNYTGGTGAGSLWGNASQWEWDWQHNPKGTAVSYVSEPLSKDTIVVGAGAVYAWVRSANPDVDLLVTVSEVTPDGKETFVQSGYMRASSRELSKNSDNMFKRPSTLLNPVPTFLESDARPMPNDFVEVAVPLYYQGHAYREGSRIRVTIAGPNGTQPIWSFSESLPKGQVDIAFGAKRPSKLVLPVIPGLDIPTELPPCPSLRNQPCRPYEALKNLRG